MQKLVISAFVFWSVAAAASAEEVKTQARVVTGAVEVDVVFMAEDNCHRIINAAPGAPAGQEVPPEVVAATVRIAREEGTCEQKTTPLAVSFALPDKERTTETVKIYYIDREGNVITTESVATPR